MSKNPPVAASCPFLPTVDEELDYKVTRRHGSDKGFAFYFDAMRFAQSLWQQGKPAQAILQLDKAWMSEIEDEGWHTEETDPYGALVWMLNALLRGAEGFGGNPVRHFQHLASRMSGPRPEPRIWRAWACLYLSERILPATTFTRDGAQMAREGLWIPGVHRVLAGLTAQSWPGEALVAAQWLESAKSSAI